MELKEILSKCDHTLLAQTATWEEIRTLCDDGIRYGCASVCIPASYVRQAAEYVAGRLPICTMRRRSLSWEHPGWGPAGLSRPSRRWRNEHGNTAQ